MRKFAGHIWPVAGGWPVGGDTRGREGGTHGMLEPSLLRESSLRSPSLENNQPDRAGSVATLPASVRASYFACLMSVRFGVNSTGRTPQARHSGSPQRPSELDRETVRQSDSGYFGRGCDRLWESIWCARGSRLVRCGDAARVVPTHQRTPSWMKGSGAARRACTSVTFCALYYTHALGSPRVFFTRQK
jgi:hypothetical protein